MARTLQRVPLSGKTLPLAIAAAAEKLGAEAAPFLITSGRAGAKTIPVAGFVPAKSTQLTSYWHMQGSRDIGPGQCIAGEFIASRLGVKPGATIPLQGAPCVVKGIVSTWRAEKTRRFWSRLKRRRCWLEENDAASVIEIRGAGRQGRRNPAARWRGNSRADA